MLAHVLHRARYRTDITGMGRTDQYDSYGHAELLSDALCLIGFGSAIVSRLPGLPSTPGQFFSQSGGILSRPT